MPPQLAAGWPTLLERVDWPAFHVALATRAERVDPTSAAELDPYTPHARFAVHVMCHVTARDLSGLLLAHQAGDVALQLGATDRLAKWLQTTAHVALGMLQYLASLTVPSLPASLPAAPRALVPGLHVDPELTDLPLLNIARELAQHIGGRHHVIAASLPPGTAGRHSPRLLVELDLAKAGDRRDAVWLHELGHALDFSASRLPEEAEDYADELGALLAEHQPGSLDQAAALCVRAHEAVTARARTRRPDLPAPGAESVQAFLALPIGP